MTVGSKNFTEQFILGEIYAQALEAAGFKIKKQLNLGSEQSPTRRSRRGGRRATRSTPGTSLTSFFDVKIEDVPKDPQQAYQEAKAEYAKDEHHRAGPDAVQEHLRHRRSPRPRPRSSANPTKISDLTGKAQDMMVNGFPECRQRIDCLLGVEQGYGLKFRQLPAR